MTPTHDTLRALAAALPKRYYMGSAAIHGGGRDTTIAMVDVKWLEGVRVLLAALEAPAEPTQGQEPE